MNGGFASLHPVPCMIYYAGVILFSMLLFHPVFLLTAVVVIVMLNLLHNSGNQLRRLLPFYLLMGGSVALLNPLFSHRGRYILFYFLDQPITLEAIIYGVTMMLSLLTILLTFVSYHHVITTDKFMYVFSVIAPKVALLILMTMRFVPLFRRRLYQITMIQKMKGISVGRGTLRQRMRHGMVLLRVLLTWSLEEALQTADSMKGRGYGITRRSMYVIYRMERRDWFILSAMVLAELICIIGWAYGYGVLQIYPHLEAMALTWDERAVYGVFCVFLLTPVFLEVRERVVWQLLK
ncbi:energy-coupling factor transporter transmembrane component T [Aneurinibacillus migulanus]|uniref:energy-coupling factor transporter transmembrane component T n=1 Tax=Aneurinibacillus migulanus TaxID=47500 RepID=UPI002E23D620|nr:energy-coupling factor transporter transmembrane component T [Aneurinibacillus migulanus]